MFRVCLTLALFALMAPVAQAQTLKFECYDNLILVGTPHVKLETASDGQVVEVWLHGEQIRTVYRRFGAERRWTLVSGEDIDESIAQAFVLNPDLTLSYYDWTADPDEDVTPTSAWKCITVGAEAEAELQGQEEIEQQRRENERLRFEAEAARRAEREAESDRLEPMQADAEAAYLFAIQQRINRNWVKPPTATSGIECVVNIRQLPGGEVVSVSIGACNGDSVVRRSIEAAVHRASPLPAPADPSVFDRDIRLTFRPDD
jgi:hypothetical protein